MDRRPVSGRAVPPLGSELDTEHERFTVTLLTPEGQRSIQVAGNEHIWDAARREGIGLPALCHQGWCLTCAARIVQGRVDQSDSVGYFEQDRKAGYALLCTAKPRSDVAIQTHQATEMRRRRLQEKLPAPYSSGL